MIPYDFATHTLNKKAVEKNASKNHKTPKTMFTI